MADVAARPTDFASRSEQTYLASIAAKPASAPDAPDEGEGPAAAAGSSADVAREAKRLTVAPPDGAMVAGNFDHLRSAEDLKSRVITAVTTRGSTEAKRTLEKLLNPDMTISFREKAFGIAQSAIEARRTYNKVVWSTMYTLLTEGASPQASAGGASQEMQNFAEAHRDAITASRQAKILKMFYEVGLINAIRRPTVEVHEGGAGGATADELIVRHRHYGRDETGALTETLGHSSIAGDIANLSNTTVNRGSDGRVTSSRSGRVVTKEAARSVQELASHDFDFEGADSRYGTYEERRAAEDRGDELDYEVVVLDHKVRLAKEGSNAVDKKFAHEQDVAVRLAQWKSAQAENEEGASIGAHESKLPPIDNVNMNAHQTRTGSLAGVWYGSADTVDAESQGRFFEYDALRAALNAENEVARSTDYDSAERGDLRRVIQNFNSIRRSSVYNSIDDYTEKALFEGVEGERNELRTRLSPLLAQLHGSDRGAMQRAVTIFRGTIVERSRITSKTSKLFGGAGLANDPRLVADRRRSLRALVLVAEELNPDRAHLDDPHADRAQDIIRFSELAHALGQKIHRTCKSGLDRTGASMSMDMSIQMLRNRVEKVYNRSHPDTPIAPESVDYFVDHIHDFLQNGNLENPGANKALLAHHSGAEFNAEQMIWMINTVQFEFMEDLRRQGMTIQQASTLLRGTKIGEDGRGPASIQNRLMFDFIPQYQYSMGDDHILINPNDIPAGRRFRQEVSLAADDPSGSRRIIRKQLMQTNESGVRILTTYGMNIIQHLANRRKS